MKPVVAVTGPVETLPLVACGPLHPPDAVQLVASVELQVRVDVPPLAMPAGVAVNVTVGTGTTDTEAV